MPIEDDLPDELRHLPGGASIHFPDIEAERAVERAGDVEWIRLLIADAVDMWARVRLQLAAGMPDDEAARERSAAGALLRLSELVERTLPDDDPRFSTIIDHFTWIGTGEYDCGEIVGQRVCFANIDHQHDLDVLLDVWAQAATEEMGG